MIIINIIIVSIIVIIAAELRVERVAAGEQVGEGWRLEEPASCET